MGSRSNWGIVARSEAEFNEIVDNLNEQEVRGRKELLILLTLKI